MKEYDPETKKLEGRLTNMVSSAFLAASLFFLGDAIVTDHQPRVIYQIDKSPEEVRKLNEERERKIKTEIGLSLILALNGIGSIIYFPQILRSIKSGK